MRKDRSIEEVRAKDRERQARWRANNKVLSRERRAYVYGKSKWPQMVEERMKPETRERYGVAERPPVIDHVTTPPGKAEERVVEKKEVRVVRENLGEKVWDDRTYDADPTDARTAGERKQDEQQQAYRARRGSLSRAGGKKASVDTLKQLDAAGRREEFARMKAALQSPGRVVSPKGGRGVEIPLEGV